jgi:hypothetical protein
MLRLRVMFALGLALAATGALAVPAAAETVLIECNGTCGYYEVKDTGPTGPKGAVCVYEKPGYDLDKITVRPPLMHGNYPGKTKVAWRYKIRRASTGGGSFSTIYTSSWQTAMASETNPVSAGDGFSRRAWMASENPNGFFDVWTELRWDHNGSQEGFARVEYDWYKALRGSQSYTNNEYCLEEY